jgi:hypothetical protein
MRPNSLVIEMSTVSPQTSRQLVEHGSRRGINVLDVTISGSTPAAEEGARSFSLAVATRHTSRPLNRSSVRSLESIFIWARAGLAQP